VDKNEVALNSDADNNEKEENEVLVNLLNNSNNKRK
jgi:hypothetical protein